MKSISAAFLAVYIYRFRPPAYLDSFKYYHTSLSFPLDSNPIMAPTPSQLLTSSTRFVGVWMFISKHNVVAILVVAYLVLVRSLRYRRANKIVSPFTRGQRPLSSMTTQEAFNIMTQLQALEFPYAINKARSVALLKVTSRTTSLRVCC